MDKYLLQKSASKPDGWVLTDTERGVVCEFLEGYFNGTRNFTVLDDIRLPDANELANIARSMGEWLLENHRDKIAVRHVIGKRLEELRKLRGLSQEDIAALTGLRYQNISRIERAVYSTGIDIIGHICDALNCRIDIVPNEDGG